MTAVMTDNTIKVCPQCGKEFSVLHQDLWVYKKRIGTLLKFFCTYGCKRQYERKEVNDMENKCKLTDEQKRIAVEIAQDGKSPYGYLRNLGAKNPTTTWRAVRSWAMKQDKDLILPESFKAVRKQEIEIPEAPAVSLMDAMDGMKDAADEFFGMCEDMGLKVAEEKLPDPQSIDGFTVQGIKGAFGRYSLSSSRGIDYLDFDGADGDELSMQVEQWRDFLDELRRAAAILGVEL